jgi:hypothetical protein
MGTLRKLGMVNMDTTIILHIQNEFQAQDITDHPKEFYENTEKYFQKLTILFASSLSWSMPCTISLSWCPPQSLSNPTTCELSLGAIHKLSLTLELVSSLPVPSTRYL